MVPLVAGGLCGWALGLCLGGQWSWDLGMRIIWIAILVEGVKIYTESI